MGPARSIMLMSNASRVTYFCQITGEAGVFFLHTLINHPPDIEASSKYFQFMELEVDVSWSNIQMQPHKITGKANKKSLRYLSRPTYQEKHRTRTLSGG